MELALGAGASFVAQVFAGDIKRMTEIIQQAMNHEGFALVNVFSPCVTYNNTYTYFKEEPLLDLKDVPDYDPTDLNNAYNIVLKNNGRVQGVIYQNNRPAYHTFLAGYPEDPIAFRSIEPDQDVLNELWAEFK